MKGEGRRVRGGAACLLLCVLFSVALSVRAAEERIWGVLEKTAQPGACAQMTDTLGDTYYVERTEDAEKAVAPYVGKNVRVVITGTVEKKEGDPARYFALKAVALPRVKAD